MLWHWSARIVNLHQFYVCWLRILQFVDSEVGEVKDWIKDWENIFNTHDNQKLQYNEIGCVHNTVHQITNTILWGVISLLKTGNNEMQISESPILNSNEIVWKRLWPFVNQTLLWLSMAETWHWLTVFSGSIKFQQNLWIHLWDTWYCPLT